MSPARSLHAAALLCALANASCTDDARARFDRDVAPVLQSRCAAAGCHGVPPGQSSTRAYRFPTDAQGALFESAHRDAAYEASRRFLDTTERVEFSSLLRKPIPPEEGGVPHGGGALFRGRADPLWRALRDWAALEHGGGEDGELASLTEGERFFADNVQGRLAEGQCMLAPCHGPVASIPLRFDPGLDGRFSAAMTRANYNEALVHLSLGGWAELSRLARKPLRDPTRRLAHRGGNGLAAFPLDLDAPLPRAIVRWARLERRLRTGQATEHPIDGIVFVGGPIAPARVVEHDAFTPGSDLYLLSPPTPDGAVRNLSASLHGAPAEVRDPAVDDTGTRVAFSLRTSAAQGATVWELDLITGRARARTTAVTLPDGRASVDRWPAYGPDGRLWFVSTRAGELAEHADGFDTDLYVIEASGAITRRTHTPSPELATTFFRQGRETSGTVAFTAIRHLGDGYKGVVYRFPPDLHAEYHQHVGITLGDDTVFHMRETADGNYLGLLLDRDARWSAGALVQVDRNFGIAIPASVSGNSSVPGYQHPASYLGPYGSEDDAIVNPYDARLLSRPVRRTRSPGAYRDPHPLPDGRAVVAWTPVEVALREPSPSPDFGLYTVTFGSDPATGATTVTRRDRLVDLPGVSETQPVPVFRNVPGRVYRHEPAGPTGLILHGGTPMLESVLRQVGPFGSRELRDDLRAVRLLGWIPRSSDDSVSERSSALYEEQRRTGATPHTPARVLAELPLAADGTFYAELDAGTAFRMQFLDARGMAIGTQQNRWFDLNGGQELRQGIHPAGYDTACGGCHGGRSGRATDAFQTVDMTARASRSLARFEDDDPDRPRPPVRVTPRAAFRSDWRADVAPLLVRSCARGRCHDDATRAGSLALTAAPTGRYDAAYEALVARGEGSLGGFRYVDVVGTTARGSHLVERLLGEELDAPRALDQARAHRGEPPLSDDEVRAIARWIEAGSTWCSESCP